MQENAVETVATSWDAKIRSFIQDEAKLNDPKKVESHAKKLGDTWVNEIGKRSAENIYINCVISKCKNITLATHISKLTHSSNKGSSMIGEKYYSDNFKYLSSTSVKTTVDGTSSAAFSEYTKFLILEHEGVILFEEILKDNSTILDAYSINLDEAKQWYKELRERYLSKPKLKSDALTKQIYFPLGHDEYLLLQILKSSSLLQAVHLSYFENEARQPYDKAKEQREKGKFDLMNTMDFPNLAKLNTVQSREKHKLLNISVLNSLRDDGRIPLFSCEPPAWKSKLQPPKGLSMFNGEFNCDKKVNTIVGIIAAYLVGYSKADLSQRHPKKYHKIARLVNQLVDILCDYALRIQEISPNWSRGSELKTVHQYWLDPYRDDTEFIAARQTSDYKSIIVSDFANWLNQSINKKESGLNLGDEQYRLWVKMTQENFRTFNELMD